MKSRWFRAAALFMLAGVALGAFGAHYLSRHLHPAALSVFKTAAYYHVVHALGLFIVAWADSQKPGNRRVRLAGLAFTSGIFLFSGSLCLLVLTGFRWFGILTPFGGLLFLAGWALLAAA